MCSKDILECDKTPKRQNTIDIIFFFLNEKTSVKMKSTHVSKYFKILRKYQKNRVI